ncbi:SPRY domain-containing protein 3-like [Uloborus diversus]|uniref:SPRY domain-containing protein 3-like n=1 Tax=Uloborus diversus TaxID=327109 RepID=UPI00240902EB|nr:SPRY domain-containing protein 3-like [Uloborus diversus]
MAEYMNRIENESELRQAQYFAEILQGVHNDLNQHRFVDLKLPSRDVSGLKYPLKKNKDLHFTPIPIHGDSKSSEESQEKLTESDSEECGNDVLGIGQSADVTEVPSTENVIYFLPVNYNKRNPWRRTIGLHITPNELLSSTYPARSSVKKLRFAQAKKPLNYLYSYFSVEILECDDKSSITIGLSRKDYPSKVAPGKNAGSVGYFSDTGSVHIKGMVHLDGMTFSQGDVIGCGIIYPSHYKRYVDLSTDDNSDGMTDVVLTSILKTNKKSMDFVCNVLNLNVEGNDGAANFNGTEEVTFGTEKATGDECDSYNENFVESRTQVEVYFTHNMRVVGKVYSYIPVGGFYPTVHVFSSSAIRMNVDLNPPTS